MLDCIVAFSEKFIAYVLIFDSCNVMRAFCNQMMDNHNVNRTYSIKYFLPFARICLASPTQTLCIQLPIGHLWIIFLFKMINVSSPLCPLWFKNSAMSEILMLTMKFQTYSSALSTRVASSATSTLHSTYLISYASASALSRVIHWRWLLSIVYYLQIHLPSSPYFIVSCRVWIKFQTQLCY